MFRRHNGTSHISISSAYNDCLFSTLTKRHAGFRRSPCCFYGKIHPNGIAIFPSKPIYLRNLDIEYPYRQESNFYYLSGFEEPESMLVINPSHPKYKYIMYVRKRDRRRETYDGPRAGVEGAMSTFKADTSLYIEDFNRTIFSFIRFDRPNLLHILN
ncbi:MAG: hypothetical protein E2O77_06240 [Caldithrix sp.]|nr:MAG: hypothetical protein E2O77_06240 [Caldithrix sp.]